MGNITTKATRIILFCFISVGFLLVTEDNILSQCTEVEYYSLNIEESGSGKGIVFSAPDGIYCHEGDQCNYEFQERVVMLTALPYNCSVLEGWYIDDKKVSSDPYLSVLKENDVTVEARFELAAECNLVPIPVNKTSHTVNVSYIVTAGAVVSEPAGIICPGQCSHSFYDEQVKLRAIQAEGNNFLGWFDEKSNLVSDRNEIILEMTKNYNLQAEFECVDNCYAMPEEIECNDNSGEMATGAIPPYCFINSAAI